MPIIYRRQWAWKYNHQHRLRGIFRGRPPSPARLRRRSGFPRRVLMFLIRGMASYPSMSGIIISSNITSTSSSVCKSARASPACRHDRQSNDFDFRIALSANIFLASSSIINTRFLRILFDFYPFSCSFRFLLSAYRSYSQTRSNDIS